MVEARSDTAAQTALAAQPGQLAPDMSVEVLFDGEWFAATVQSVDAEAVSVTYEEAQDDEDVPIAEVETRIRCQLAPDMSVEVVFDGEWFAATVQSVGAEAVSLTYTESQHDEDVSIADVGTRIRLLQALSKNTALTTLAVQPGQLAPDMPVEVLFEGEWFAATVGSVGAEAVSVTYEEAQDDEDVPIADVEARIRCQLVPDMSVEVLFNGEWFAATVRSVAAKGVSVWYLDALDDEDVPNGDISARIRLAQVQAPPDILSKLPPGPLAISALSPVDKVRAKIMELEAELEDCVSQRKFARCGELEGEIKRLKAQATMMLKAQATVIEREAELEDCVSQRKFARCGKLEHEVKGLKAQLEAVAALALKPEEARVAAAAAKGAAESSVGGDQALQAKIKALEAEIEDCVSQRNFARCGELEGEIKRLKAQAKIMLKVQAKIEALETELADCVSQRNFALCGVLEGEIKRLKARLGNGAGWDGSSDDGGETAVGAQIGAVLVRPGKTGNAMARATSSMVQLQGAASKIRFPR